MKIIRSLIPLQNEVAERRKAEVSLEKRTHDLGERLKELNCLYGISELVNKKDISVEEIMQRAVDLIPPAWQYPEITCARINIEGREFKTEGFSESSWKQSQDILVFGELAGTVEIYYSEEKTEMDEGPFLKEERHLINVISKHLSEMIEHKRAGKDLARGAKELARVNAELQRIVYIASHDLQEPLRMVTSYVQLLSIRYKGRLDHEADEFISFIEDGAQKMRMLVKDLLTYSRIETYGKSLKKTDLGAVLKNTLMNLQKAVEDSRAEITNDPLPEVMADEGQLTQLFQNLIANAIKFHGEKAPKVHVSARQEQDNWVFSVKDNGIGIEEKHKERIFQIFQRLHSRSEYEGTGIGLAVCRRIVERHGGRIWVESEPGEGPVPSDAGQSPEPSGTGHGTTFYFTMPVRKPEDEK